jgi:hypothetical protein
VVDIDTVAYLLDRSIAGADIPVHMVDQVAEEIVVAGRIGMVDRVVVAAALYSSS